MSKGTTKYRRCWSGSEFLDPENVGSSVRWVTAVKVIQFEGTDKRPAFTTGTLDAAIYLTDCDDAISWSHYGESAEKIHRKIDRAITQLREFQRTVLLAEKAIKKHHTAPEKDDDE